MEHRNIEPADISKELYEQDMKFMAHSFPNAKTGTFIRTGEKYWIVPVQFQVGAEIKNWTFMLLYPDQYPDFRNYGGNHLTVPIKPSIEELRQKAADAGRISVSNGCIPHIWYDAKRDMYWLDTLTGSDLHKTGIPNAASAVARAIRWALLYESGLTDPNIWKDFSGY